MGRDKGLIECEEPHLPEVKNWAHRAFLTLAEALGKKTAGSENMASSNRAHPEVAAPEFPGVVVSINPAQLESYQKFFPQKRLVVDTPEATPCEGPLRGILSVHRAYPNYDLLVIAADMIKLGREPLEMLLQKRAVNENSFDLFLFESAHGIEPLCALYRAGCLKNMADHSKEALDAGCSLRKLIGRYQVETVKEHDYDDQLVNRNFSF